MIFLGFSSKDRFEIAERMLFQLSDFGLPVWYDRREMLMGDDRNFKNFDEGIGKSSYAVLIMSRNAFASPCVEEEANMIYDMHKQGRIVVFPIFYNVKAQDLPSKYEWLRQMVYKELTTGDSIKPACNHIVCRVLADELHKYRLNDVRTALKHYSSHQSSHFLKCIFKRYVSISESNKDARMALLFSVIAYIQERFSIPETEFPYYGAIRYLMNRTELNLENENRETKIMEQVCILYLNFAILRSFV